MKRRLYCEIFGAVNLCRNVKGNSFKKKLTLLALIGLWLVFEIGIFVYQLEPPTSMWVIRALAIYVIGRAHEVEVERLEALTGGKE